MKVCPSPLGCCSCGVGSAARPATHARTDTHCPHAVGLPLSAGQMKRPVVPVVLLVDRRQRRPSHTHVAEWPPAPLGGARRASTTPPLTRCPRCDAAHRRVDRRDRVAQRLHRRGRCAPTSNRFTLHPPMGIWFPPAPLRRALLLAGAAQQAQGRGGGRVNGDGGRAAEEGEPLGTKRPPGERHAPLSASLAPGGGAVWLATERRRQRGRGRTSTLVARGTPTSTATWLPL